MLETKELSLNQVLKRLGYKVVNHRERPNGTHAKSIRKDGKAIRFPEGTISGEYNGVHNLNHITADIVWKWLYATGQIV